jgi:hypothetical protein
MSPTHVSKEPARLLPIMGLVVIALNPPAPAAWGTRVGNQAACAQAHSRAACAPQRVSLGPAHWGYSAHAIDACAYESEFLPGMIIPSIFI